MVASCVACWCGGSRQGTRCLPLPPVCSGKLRDSAHPAYSLDPDKGFGAFFAKDVRHGELLWPPYGGVLRSDLEMVRIKRLDKFNFTYEFATDGETCYDGITYRNVMCFMNDPRYGGYFSASVGLALVVFA